MIARVLDAIRRTLTENLRFALTALRAHKLRAFLTMVGIVIGVWTVIGMVSLVTGFDRSQTEAFSSFGTTLVQFQKFEPRFGPGHRSEEERKRKDLTIEDAQALQEMCPSILAVSPERYLWSASQVKGNGNEANSPQIGGVNQNYAICNNWEIKDGRNITETDVLHGTDVTVLGQDVVESLFKGKDPLGQEITINGRRMQVVGTFVKKGSSGFGGQPDNIAVIPISTFDRHFPQTKNSHDDTIHIATIPRSPELVEKVIEEGTALLRARRKVPFNAPNDFAIFTAEKMLAQMQAVTNAISGVMVLIAAIALVVGGVGVMNIMLVSVTERTREIGLRMAVGARARDILRQFLIEAVLLCLVGGVLGILVGRGSSYLISAILKWPTEISVAAIVAAVAVSAAVGISFGYYPAWKGSRLDPIDALHYE